MHNNASPFFSFPRGEGGVRYVAIALIIVTVMLLLLGRTDFGQTLSKAKVLAQGPPPADDNAAKDTPPPGPKATRPQDNPEGTEGHVCQRLFFKVFKCIRGPMLAGERAHIVVAALVSTTLQMCRADKAGAAGITLLDIGANDGKELTMLRDMYVPQAV